MISKLLDGIDPFLPRRSERAHLHQKISSPGLGPFSQLRLPLLYSYFISTQFKESVLNRALAPLPLSRCCGQILEKKVLGIRFFWNNSDGNSSWMKPMVSFTGMDSRPFTRRQEIRGMASEEVLIIQISFNELPDCQFTSPTYPQSQRNVHLAAYQWCLSLSDSSPRIKRLNL